MLKQCVRTFSVFWIDHHLEGLAIALIRSTLIPVKDAAELGRNTTDFPHALSIQPFDSILTHQYNASLRPLPPSQ
jgi:hypothetical protein